MASVVKANCELVKQLVDERLRATDPSKVVVLTAGVTFALAYLYGQLTDRVKIYQFKVTKVTSLTIFIY